jgi:glycosyltransferase
MNRPPLSIITVTYNAAKTVADCIASVAQQTFHAEQIIVDGNSPDGTGALASRLLPVDGKILVEPDRGAYHAMNKGIALATGEVIGILNADDLYADPTVLARVASLFSDESLDSCYGDLTYVAPDNVQLTTRYWSAGPFSRNSFYWGWMPPHPTFFVRRRVYEQFGMFNLNLGSAADYELMLRVLFKHRISTVYLPRVLVAMRSGGISNRSLRNRLKAHQMDRKAWFVNNLTPYPWTILCKPLRKIPQYFLRAPVMCDDKTP